MVKLEFNNQRLVIDKLGAGIAQYFIKENGRQQNIVYGYSSREKKDGSMGDILSPFPGRVEDARYCYNGKSHRLRKVKIKGGQAIHGFVKERSWDLKKVGDSQIIASYLLDGTKDQIGYPFKLDYQIDYTLSNKGLTVDSRVKNVGSNKAPFGLGFHPYFDLGCQVDEMEISFQAKKMVEFDRDLKPTGKLIDIEETDYDFIEPKKINDLVIDNCFTELVRNSNGIHEMVLDNKQNKRKITIWQDRAYDYLQLYSADTKKEPLKRRALAVEPQTCSGFAFNLPELGLIDLRPNETFKASWGVTI